MPPVTSTSPATGLTAEDVRDRVARGLTNEAGERTSRTYREIIRANVLTRFNAILGTMLAVILVVGPIQDATFGIILVANALIGIVQAVWSFGILGLSMRTTHKRHEACAVSPR